MAKQDVDAPVTDGAANAAKLDISPKLLIDNYRGELDAAALYRTLAKHEKSAERAGVLREMASDEERHACVMADRLGEMGISVPNHSVSMRVRVLGWLARVFGTRAVLPIVESFEAGDVSAYLDPNQDGVVRTLAPDERKHFRAVSSMTSGGVDSVDIVGHERWHRSAGGGTLRAAVFGVSDGLVSNLALVMGFAGAQADAQYVVLAGVAGLLAGAFSMGAGEYVSMRAQRELFERQIALEETELLLTPDEERRELALIYRAKGVPADEAEQLAGRLLENKEAALDTLAREELGLDPTELGSPWGAALGSFVAFTAGAIIPVIAYCFGASGWVPFTVSALMSAAALFLVGAGVSLFTGKSALYSGARQLGIGALAAAVTFAIGTAIGAATEI